MLQRLLFASTLALCLTPLLHAHAHNVQVNPGSNVQIVEGGHTHVVTEVVEPAPELHLHAAPVSDRPSVWQQSMQGFLGGSLVGLSVAYLFVHGGRNEAWRDLLLGAGIGAVSGAGLGFGLGLLDAADDSSGRLRYVTRDMLYGTGVGALVGGVTGGLVALKSGEAKDILLGGAIGVISGSVLGIVAGLVEGQLRRPKVRHVRARLTLSQSGPDARSAMHSVVPTVVGVF